MITKDVKQKSESLSRRHIKIYVFPWILYRPSPFIYIFILVSVQRCVSEYTAPNGWKMDGLRPCPGVCLEGLK